MLIQTGRADAIRVSKQTIDHQSPKMDSFGTEYLSLDCANRTMGVAHMFVYNKVDIIRRSLRAMKNILNDEASDPLRHFAAQLNPVIFLLLEKVDLLGDSVKNFTSLQRVDRVITYLDSLNVRDPIVLVEEQPLFNTTSPLVQVAIITWARMRGYRTMEIDPSLKNTPTWCGSVKQIRLGLEISTGKKSRSISYRARKIHSMLNFIHLARKYSWRVKDKLSDDETDAAMMVIVVAGID